ncbi:MAG: DNA-processing protein DprA [Saprospiraceae bacterium]
MNDLLYQIGLTRIPLVGAVTARTLVSYCGSAAAVFAAKKKDLLKIPGIGERIAANIHESDALREAEKELHFVEKNQIRVLFYLDDAYPEKLKHYSDSPILLFYKGNADLNTSRVVAIVGTRQPTPQGIAFCEELVEGLKPYNVLILSGLAYGIDVTSHRKSVEIGVPTVAALGHGFQTIYPAQHRSVAERMCEHGGLLTEFPSNTLPDREHFPMRNKIIAGLCDALVVIETAIRGGSMITAHMANEYNKDVFAVPGRVQDKNSQGCNHLIKTHKAALLESAADIAYVMRWEEEQAPKLIQRQLFVELSEDEKIVVNLLRQNAEVHVDRLLYEMQLTGSEMAALLLELEFKGIIKSLPGKRYTLIQHPNQSLLSL